MSDSSEPASPGIIHEFPRRDRFDRIDQHERQHRTHEHHQNGVATSSPPTIYVPPAYMPGGRRSLSGVSIRAFGLGIALGLCSLLTVEFVYWGYGLWRAPSFVAILTLFHYLEFDMTARYNPPDASISSYLLLSNGIAYAAAHTAAILELLLRYWLHSEYKPQWLSLPFSIPSLTLGVPTTLSVGTGIVLVVIGQFVRSTAMKQANTNFNHVVQWTKRSDHILVTHGVYAFSRHPSYFGFFWWGLGTQVLMGNRFCLVAYAVVLWKFFSHRIRNEERHLVSFFGQQYLDYRDRVPVRIPFIR